MKILAFIVLIAMSFAAVSAYAEPSPVVVRSKLDPVEASAPGQPVRLLIDVLFAGAMPRPPAVEVGEAAGAQVMRFETQALTIRERIDGQDYIGQRFEFVLFARRSGTIVVPPAQVTLFDASGDPAGSGKGESLTLAVAAPPGLDLSGPVLATTALTATQTWDPDPKLTSFKPGAALTRTISRRAAGVPALGMADLVFVAPAGARVYPDAPQSSDRVERGAVEGSRVDKATYVFEQPGVYDIPALVQPWWNLEDKKARSTMMKGLHVVVEAASAPVERSASPRWPRWAWIVGGACGVALAVGLCFVAVPQIRLMIENRQQRRQDSEAAARRALRKIAPEGDALATYAALTTWLRRLRPSVTVEAQSDPRFALLYDDLRRALFGDGEWSSVRGIELATAVATLSRALARRQLSPREVLPPLNPRG
jgi:hypothetical protein